MPAPTDPYLLHRLALAPFRRDGDPASLRRLPQRIAEVGEDRFLGFLHNHGLSALWHEAMEGAGLRDRFPAQFRATLKHARMIHAAHHLAQTGALRRIDGLFGDNAIPYAVFKGAHVRELLYEHPYCRPCTDIDILVGRADRDKAIKMFTGAGFRLDAVAQNISHEATLHDAGTSIDLHWDILRPGRLRVDLSEGMVGNRTRLQDFWVMDDADGLFVMLVHPVFTKYLTTPWALLVRLVDLHRWLGSREVDWDRQVEMLQRSGVKTAAWIALYWQEYMLGTGVPEEVRAALSPGAARRRYLELWIRNDWPGRFRRWPLLTQLAFTLPAQDTAKDAIRFLSALREDRRTRGKAMDRIEAQSEGRS